MPADLAPPGLDFFQAIFLLEQFLHRQEATEGPALKTGRDHPPEREPIRFRSDPSLSFAAHTITGIELKPGTARNARALVRTTVMGLAGREGPLPSHYAKEVIRQNRERNTALHDFLDLLSHRLVSLFYRAWLKHRPLESAFDDLAERKTESPVVQALLAFAGYADAAKRSDTGLPEWLFLKYVGLWAAQSRPASGLQAMLADFLGMPAVIEEFSGGRLTLDAGERTVLGGGLGNPDNARLGRRAMLGDSVFRPETGFRVRLGPMDFAAFRSLLPDGERIGQVRALIRCYARAETGFDVQLVLDGAEAPPCGLGAGEQDGTRLGWTSWLITGPVDRVHDDAIFSEGG